MKKLMSVLEVFGLTGDALTSCVARRVREPAVRGSFVSHHIATDLHEQGDVVGASGFEMLADTAMYQELRHKVD